jgi:hypothetical protein
MIDSLYSFWEKGYWNEFEIAVIFAKARRERSITGIKYSQLRKPKKQTTFCGTPSLSCHTGIGKM